MKVWSPVVRPMLLLLPLLVLFTPTSSAQTLSPPFTACGLAIPTSSGSATETAVAWVEWKPDQAFRYQTGYWKVTLLSASSVIGSMQVQEFRGHEDPESLGTLGPTRPVRFEGFSDDPTVSFHLLGVQDYVPQYPPYYAESMVFVGHYQEYALSLVEAKTGVTGVCPYLPL